PVGAAGVAPVPPDGPGRPPCAVRQRFHVTIPNAVMEDNPMTESLYPKPTRALAEKRRSLAPDAEAAFRQFGQAVFQDGALSAKTKQLIAVASAHVTQCAYCIQGHTRAAIRAG